MKKLKLADKEINIPKLGLKHHALIKDEKDPIVALQKIMKSIYPGMTAAESDYTALHLLAFNGRIKEVSTVDGFTYSLDTLYICQRLKFQFHGTEYNFKSHDAFQEFGPVDQVLESLYLGDDVPDFLDMPAFVSKWADDITSTVAISGPQGPVKGMLQIMEILK